MTKSSKGVADDSLGILNLVRTCQNYHTLPRGGGLLDQDALFVNIMFNIAAWESARAELDDQMAKRKAS